MGDSGECFSYLVLGFGNFEEYHGVQIWLLLGTIWLLRAKIGQLLSFLIALGQGKEVYFDYLGFCLLVLVNLRCMCIIVTCNSLSYFDLKVTEFWAWLLFLLKPAKSRLI